MMLTVVSVTYTNRVGPWGYGNCVYKNEGFIDSFYSLIWVERYYEAGEFELKIEASTDNIKLLKEDYYIKADFSDYTMIIEKIELVSDAENGDYMLVSGRSLESILDRRIIYNRLQFTGDAKGNTYLKADKVTHPAMVRNVIDTIIYENFIKDLNRTMYEFGVYSGDYTKVSPTQQELENATNPPYLEMYVSASMYGESCYDVICKICQDLGIGFKMGMDFTSGRGTKFSISLYYGLNLTSDLEKNQSGKVVVFSPLFDNLLTSDYILDKRDYKNFVKVDGIYHEENGGQLVEKEVSEDVLGKIISGKELINPVSAERRETYLDANNVSDKIHYNLIVSNSSGSSGYASFATDADRDKYLSATNYAKSVKFTFYMVINGWMCDAIAGASYTTADLYNTFGITITGGFANLGYFTTYASYIEQNNTTERIITESGFKNRLSNEGKGTLLEREYLEDVTTEVLPDITYSYGKSADDDYYLGDIVEFMDKYGSVLNCRITEMTTSIDEEGIKREPTFLPVSSNLNQLESE